jgi:hypothetical protein
MKIYYIVPTHKHAGSPYLRKGLPEGFAPCSLDRAQDAVDAWGGFSRGPSFVYEVDYDLVRRTMENAEDGEEFGMQDLFEGSFLGLCRLDEETRKWVLK